MKENWTTKDYLKTNFFCDFCDSFIEAKEIKEDGVLELVCPACGEVSVFILYRMG